MNNLRERLLKVTHFYEDLNNIVVKQKAQLVELEQLKAMVVNDDKSVEGYNKDQIVKACEDTHAILNRIESEEMLQLCGDEYLKAFTEIYTDEELETIVSAFELIDSFDYNVNMDKVVGKMEQFYIDYFSELVNPTKEEDSNLTLQ